MRGGAAGAIREAVIARSSGECSIGFTTSPEAGERLRKTNLTWVFRMVLKIAVGYIVK